RLVAGEEQSDQVEAHFEGVGLQLVDAGEDVESLVERAKIHERRGQVEERLHAIGLDLQRPLQEAERLVGSLTEQGDVAAVDPGLFEMVVEVEGLVERV